MQSRPLRTAIRFALHHPSLVKNSPVAKKMQSASTAEIEVVQPVEEVAPTEVIEQQQLKVR